MFLPPVIIGKFISQIEIFCNSDLGIVGATVVVYYGQGKSTNSVTVNESGVWTTTISSQNLDTNVKIAAIQSINGMSSVTSDPVSFILN